VSGGLVSTAWLAAHSDDPEVLLFDTTKYLPNDPRDAEALFLAARLPRARRFDVDRIADTESSLPHMAPAPGRFARMAGALGIANTHFVVFYDQTGITSAVRGWWMMGLFGHDRAAVLDGGLPKWRAEGRALVSGEPEPPEPAIFRPDYRATWVRGIGDVLANLVSGAELVLDVRSAGRFAGTAPEPRPNMRGGHVPGSVNLPFTELLAADGTLLPRAALQRRLARAGVDGRRPVVSCCGTGMTACVANLAMVQAGLPIGAVYDGSWAEWGGRLDTPVVTGAVCEASDGICAASRATSASISMRNR
jgi:thiosulfate/3-mercaptopyruvate sulfurtransferase